MTPALQANSATILTFPASATTLRRLAVREPWARLEREAAEGCEAASGAWYHHDAVRGDVQGR